MLKKDHDAQTALYMNCGYGKDAQVKEAEEAIHQMSLKHLASLQAGTIH